MVYVFVQSAKGTRGVTLTWGIDLQNPSRITFDFDFWLWWYKIQVLSVIGPCSGSQNWNWLASVVWGWCQSDHDCNKTETGLGGLGANQIIVTKLKVTSIGGLGMVPIRSWLWQNWNWPRWSGCQSDHCDKTESDLDRWSGDGANQIIIVTKLKLASGSPPPPPDSPKRVQLNFLLYFSPFFPVLSFRLQFTCWKHWEREAGQASKRRCRSVGFCSSFRSKYRGRLFLWFDTNYQSLSWWFY